MRHIRKDTATSHASVLLTEWIAMRWNASQSLSYNDFDSKCQLNDYLRAEQGNICCYCQQLIDHYQSPNEAGSHNEHFIPQSQSHADEELQVDYTNIYACCNYSKGRRKGETHCGEAKGDKLIPENLLLRSNCSSCFKYNTIGEILPQCTFHTFEECTNHKSELNIDEQNALDMITALNLNQQALVKKRKDVQTDLFRFMNLRSCDSIRNKAISLNGTLPYAPFIDMLLYFMKSHLSKP
jgi:uncharacterized protein (TIGR02646 family)